MIEDAVELDILNSADYDPVLGYPTAIDIGSDIPDGRLVFEMTSFTRTP